MPSRQPLAELPLSYFIPSLFPPTPSSALGGLSTPHPGAYKPKAPPSPQHPPQHIHPKAHGGVKRPHSTEGSPSKGESGTPAKRRHLEDGAVGKRLFEDVAGGSKATSTPVRSKAKNGLAPSPDITARTMPPPASTGFHSVPTTVKPKAASSTANKGISSLSVPSSALHPRTSPTPSEEDKENQPPRPRRSVLLSASKALHKTPTTPRSKANSARSSLSATKAKGKGLGTPFLPALGALGKPATPREIGREMMLREIDEPEEVDEEMF